MTSEIPGRCAEVDADVVAIGSVVLLDDCPGAVDRDRARPGRRPIARRPAGRGRRCSRLERRRRGRV